MTSLGKILAQNIAVENSKRVDPAVLAEQKRQEHIRKLVEMGNKFFAHAQEFFVDGIQQAIPIDELSIIVGGRGEHPADRHHDEIYQELDWFMQDGRRMPKTCGATPASMLDPDRFATCWETFKQWAASNDLEAYWKCHNFGTWWNLHVKPSVA